MIRYDYNKKRVTQCIGTIYSGNLEGCFEDVINHLLKEFGDYKKYLEEPQEVVENGWPSYEKYNDGSTKKMVKFDKLRLDWHNTYDDERELRVLAERDMDASELAAYDVLLAEQKEREKEQLRKLKEKYPDV